MSWLNQRLCLVAWKTCGGNGQPASDSLEHSKVVPTITARGSCWTPQSPVSWQAIVFLYISLPHMSEPITAHCCWTVVSPLSPDRRLYFCNNQSQHRAVGLPLVPCLEGRRLFFFFNKWPITAPALLDCCASPLSSVTGDCFNYPITACCCWTYQSPVSLYRRLCFISSPAYPLSCQLEINIHIELYFCCKQLE